jgi:hypothetical protein
MLFRLTFFFGAPARAAFLSLTPVFRLELGMRSSKGLLSRRCHRIRSYAKIANESYPNLTAARAGTRLTDLRAG